MVGELFHPTNAFGKWLSKILASFNSAVKGLRRLTVQSSFRHRIPENLIIPSCNLELGKTVGQGTHPLFVGPFVSNQLNVLGEFGIVYKGYWKQSFSGTTSDVVAVKTLKG